MKFINFCSKFRHSVKMGDACLILYSTQRFFDLNKVIRANCTDILISGNIKSKKELESIENEYADAIGGKANFYRLFNEVAKEPFNWMYIKLDETPVRVFKNFTTQLYP